jgi:integral membrane sensor domain MASE1
MTGTRRLKIYVVGYLLGILISYVLSSVIRIISGTRASAAWLPSSALVGLWAGFPLWVVTAAILGSYINRRRKRDSP